MADLTLREELGLSTLSLEQIAEKLQKDAHKVTVQLMATGSGRRRITPELIELLDESTLHKMLTVLGGSEVRESHAKSLLSNDNLKQAIITKCPELTADISGICSTYQRRTSGFAER